MAPAIRSHQGKNTCPLRRWIVWHRARLERPSVSEGVEGAAKPVRLVPLDAAILRRGPFLIEDVDPKPTLILVFKFSYSLAVLVLPAPHNVRLLFRRGTTI